MSTTDTARAAPPKQPSLRDYAIFDADMEGKGFEWGLVRRLFAWIGPYRALAWRALAFVLLASCFAVLAPVVITRVVVDNILLPDEGIAAPDFGTQALNGWLSQASDLPPLLTACLLYGAFVAGWSIFGHLFRVSLARAVLGALRDLRRDIFAHLERLPARFYDRVAVGRVMTRVTNDIETLFELLAGFGVLLGEFVPFFTAVAVMLALDLELTGILMIALPLAAGGTYIFRLATRQVYRGIRQTLSRLNENLQENLSGVEVVQLYRREQINLERYQAINEENRTQETRAVQVESLYGPYIDSLVFIAMAVIVWFGGQFVFEDAITVGSVILFAQFADMLFRPIVAMGEQWNVLFRAMASAERIFQALDWDEKVPEPANPAKLPAELEGRIEFRHLTFGYQPATPILNDVSFTIEPGETIAIVGPTGSGKTSLIRLLCRFYEIAPGQIFLDNIDLTDIATRDVRERIGVVLQDFHIFSGSVVENIALGDPRITREKAIEAAKAVHADPFIRALPQGYDTSLVERGGNLSHGQRQLLAFARVLAADPEILILDEATASVDTETETVIQDALRRLTRGRTSIIIAHRLQTIRDADRIVVLAHGQVREIGSHAELMEKDGLYATLYRLQVQELDA